MPENIPQILPQPKLLTTYKISLQSQNLPFYLIFQDAIKEYLVEVEQLFSRLDY